MAVRGIQAIQLREKNLDRVLNGSRLGFFVGLGTCFMFIDRIESSLGIIFGRFDPEKLRLTFHFSESGENT
jgi:hypothetical protein